MRWIPLALALAASPAIAETAIAARTIPARTILSQADLAASPDEVPGGASLETALGLEARVTIFQGRPILRANLVPPALVERNQAVRLLYRRGGLTIVADGRALERAAAGDSIRVLASGTRTTVTGRVMGDGSIKVSTSE